MPIVNDERWSHVQFFSERDFLELGTRSNGEKIIQIGTEGDEPIVAVARTDDPWSENLNPVELYSLLKMSNAHYTFYEHPKKLVRNVKTIHKYPIPANGEFSIELPVDAEILTVKFQKDKPCIWVLLDTEKPKYKRNFCWILTDEPIENMGLVYIETLMSNDDDRVSHLFELVVKIPAVIRGIGGIYKTGLAKDLELLEIHVQNSDGEGLPHEVGERVPVTLLIGSSSYLAGVRATSKNPYLWICPDLLNEDGTDLKLAYILESEGFQKNQRINLEVIGDNIRVLP